MHTYPYSTLSRKGEDSATFRRRLLAFAIQYRLSRPSNFAYVGQQIITLKLEDTFRQFTPSAEFYDSSR